jgi:hypothetical protein
MTKSFLCICITSQRVAVLDMEVDATPVLEEMVYIFVLRLVDRGCISVFPREQWVADRNEEQSTAPRLQLIIYLKQCHSGSGRFCCPSLVAHVKTVIVWGFRKTRHVRVEARREEG